MTFAAIAMRRRPRVPLCRPGPRRWRPPPGAGAPTALARRHARLARRRGARAAPAERARRRGAGGRDGAAAVVVLLGAQGAGISGWSALDPDIVRETLGTKVGAVWGASVVVWVGVAALIAAAFALRRGAAAVASRAGGRARLPRPRAVARGPCLHAGPRLAHASGQRDPRGGHGPVDRGSRGARRCAARRHPPSRAERARADAGRGALALLADGPRRGRRAGRAASSKRSSRSARPRTCSTPPSAARC